MTLKDTQRSAIAELVSLSATARNIANRVDSSLVAQADLEELKRVIVTMNDQIASLQGQIEDAAHPEAVFNDEEAHDFMTALTKVVEAMPYRLIVTHYGVSYLRDYPKNIRVLICTVLLNVFQKRKMTPLDEWSNVVANNGSL